MVVSTEERVNELIDNLNDIDFITFKEIMAGGAARRVAEDRVTMRDQYQSYKSIRKIRKPDCGNHLSYPFD